MKVPINPKLPRDFDNTRNEDRPASHQRWWDRPFIRTMTLDDWRAHYAKYDSELAAKGQTPPERESFYAEWLKAWPTGTRYEVRCLDGGAWDRSTCWGMFATLDEAMQCAGGARIGFEHRRMERVL
jgi:hypothetical protein